MWLTNIQTITSYSWKADLHLIHTNSWLNSDTWILVYLIFVISLYEKKMFQQSNHRLRTGSDSSIMNKANMSSSQTALNLGFCPEPFCKFF